MSAHASSNASRKPVSINPPWRKLPSDPLSKGDLCHRRSIRCRPSEEDSDRCQNCYDFDVSCTYDRPSKRRKHPSAPAAPQQSPSGGQASSSRISLPLNPPGPYPHNQPRPDMAEADMQYDLVNRNKGDESRHGTAALIAKERGREDVSVAWKAFALSCEGAINELLDVYMDIIYPLYPLFHHATLKQRVTDKEHLTNRGFFASIMGACALASARIRDGALPQRRFESMKHAEVSSEVFCSAAKDAMDKDLTKNSGFDYLRACTLLALVNIQYGQIGTMQQWLGMFFTLVSMQRSYDERYWGENLSKNEIESRRRIYWCTYCLDVYGAAIWDCFLRSQEIHTNVRYPGEMDDESVSDSTTPDNEPVSWLVGWNFATDLYRVLEHILNKARLKQFRHDDRRHVDSLVFQETFSDKNVMQTMLNMYYELPTIFKETPPMTGNVQRDIYSYQAANIQATLQLLRMILFSMEDGPGIERKCDVAGEVLAVFHTIPREYLRGISTPLIYHLGGIGQVLASVISSPLSEHVYERVRTSLLSMASLLDSLESGLQRDAGAAKGLRDEVQKLEVHQRAQRRLAQQGPSHGVSPPNIPHYQAPSQISPAPHAAHNTQPHPQHAATSNYPGPAMAGPEFQLPSQLFGDWAWTQEYGPSLYPGGVE